MRVARATRADHDRRSLRARSPRAQDAIARLGIRSLEIDLAIPEQAGDDRHRLLESVHAMIERIPKCGVLRLIPPGAECRESVDHR